MGLIKDIEDACVKGLGPDASDAGNCPDIADGIANAIVDFLEKQTFRITEMKAILEVEKMTTSAPYPADVQPTVMVASGIPTAGSPAAQVTVAPGTLQGTQKGVLVPKVNFSKTGGQGGALQSKGYAYIGNNPVGETNEKKTKVRLLKEDIKGL